jgi:hypothetical protein
VFNPASLGYSLKFNGTFGNAGDVDWANTQAPGFKWYPCKADQDATPRPASDFRVASNGVLTITPPVADETGQQLCSAIPVSTPPLWRGNAFSGGWYIEFSIAFDNTTLNLGAFDINGIHIHWPGVLALPIQKMIAGADTTLPPAGMQWLKQPSGFIHYVENDMFEYNTGITNGWDATTIDFWGIYKSTCPPQWCDTLNISSHFITLPPPVKWTNFNTFGQLWIPGTAANNYKGSTTYYFNGIKMPGGVTWTDQGVGSPSMLQTPSGNPASTANGLTFSVMDSQAYYIILGTGYTTPLQVQWVHVWQKP